MIIERWGTGRADYSTEISGQTVNISGQYVGATQQGAWVVQVSGELTASVSGQPIKISGEIIKAEQYGTWGVQVSGELSIKKATTMSTTIYRVTAESGGTQIATINTARQSILIQSLDGDIYIKESPLQSGEGIKIIQNGGYTTDKYVGGIWAYAVISGNKVVVSEEA